MSGRLKASTNRVRTSDSLQGNSMWNKTIGISDAQLGTNTAVDALINAPQVGGGRAARRAAAQEIVEATGGYDTAVNNYESLLSLARSQGALGGQNRGACKRCGQLGHLTKQCRNVLAAAAADGGAPGLAAAPVLPPPPEGGEGSESSDLSLSSSGSEGSSGSDSDSSGAARRRKKEKKEKARRRAKKERRETKRRKEARRRRRDKKQERR